MLLYQEIRQLLLLMGLFMVKMASAGADDNHDCWDVCSLYLGRVNHTASGTRCQSWHAQVPHQHYYQGDDWFPLEGLDAVENYCRDPEGGWWKPWCFTEDPDVRWELCDIPLCNSTTTSKDINCGETGCEIDRSHCTNLLTDLWTTEPVTREAVTDANHECWDVCSLYLGSTNVTASGIRCQSWRAQVPHKHYYQGDDWFPFEGLDAVENYCRDPEGGWWKPWCFTEDPEVRWEQCDIPLCNSQKTSKRIKCGPYVCNINRSHCPNDTHFDTDNYYTYDVTSNDEEVVPLSIGVSLVIIVAVLLVLSMIGAALFVVLLKADRREKEWRMRAEAEAKPDKQESKDVTTISGQIDSEDVTPVVYGAFKDTEMGTSYEM